MAERWETSRKRHSVLADNHKIMCGVIGVLVLIIVIVVGVLSYFAVRLNRTSS